MNTRKWTSVVVICAALAAALAGYGRSRALAQETEHEAAMKRKLETAQELLAGIARSDFPLIQRSAERLERLSIDAQWSHIEDPEYGDHGAEFRATARRVASNASEKNIEGVTLNFMQMVMTCVECHRRKIGEGDVAFGPALEEQWARSIARE